MHETRTFFAWLPISIYDETRWLEKVTVYGYWRDCFIGMEFVSEEFIDNNKKKDNENSNAATN